jgi:hypothetical protein
MNTKHEQQQEDTKMKSACDSLDLDHVPLTLIVAGRASADRRAESLAR